VVDDNSTDKSAEIAAHYGVKVVSAPALPSDWQGKPHACHLGAKTASGDWLLFTDADTFHASDGVTLAVTTAVQNNWHGLSAILSQESSGWWDRLTLLAAYTGLFAGMRRNTNIMNGQYILLRRDVYEKSGGFTAVKNEPLEDLALGYHLNTLGYKVPLVRGEHVASVRMYSHPKQMVQGMQRVGAGSLRWLGAGAWIMALFTTLAMRPMRIFLRPRNVASKQSSFLRTWFFVVAGFWPWARRFHVTGWAFLAPLGAVIVQVVASLGMIKRFLGRGVYWKQRLVRGL
jgi:chlorobactene glucosyltransferase